MSLNANGSKLDFQNRQSIEPPFDLAENYSQSEGFLWKLSQEATEGVFAVPSWALPSRKTFLKILFSYSLSLSLSISLLFFFFVILFDFFFCIGKVFFDSICS